jgi:uncharacterized protein (UPF0371 family)
LPEPSKRLIAKHNKSKASRIARAMLRKALHMLSSLDRIPIPVENFVQRVLQLAHSVKTRRQRIDFPNELAIAVVVTAIEQKMLRVSVANLDILVGLVRAPGVQNNPKVSATLNSERTTTFLTMTNMYLH